ncbi:MAG: hypothetical protein K1X89_29200 [Myxococcaceae bacterium]|nr:hypothetical protein [Myxococcaceae bacterium]
MSRLGPAALALALLGCPRPEAPAVEDPLVTKLKAEQARLAQERARVEANPLAELAVAPQETRALRLPGEARCELPLGTFTVETVSASHQAQGAKAAVSVEGDFFLEVRGTFAASGNGALSLSSLQVFHGGEALPRAVDAQAAAGTRERELPVGPGQRRAVSVWFLAPPGALTPGLSLRCGPNSEVVLQ